MIGKTLGHYQLLDRLGEGGMGVVYRARDTRLGRDVAVKVLPDSFASDPERVARFRQEARLLASLDHPNIAAIHGLEEADGVRFLVMELVPGETLAGRIRRGPLPITEALSLCSQIADALASAHDKGVIHRDLKPANVAVTPEGKIKVLDFGLAKALGVEPGPAAADASQSPTLTFRETGRGVILGTAGYMSPEQARGKPLDRRTDVWSFGCVLYEALTGKQAFQGDTLSDTIARILEREPDWVALPSEAGARIRALLERCLRKDPQERLRDLWDARLEMNDALRRPQGVADAEGGTADAEAGTAGSWTAAGWRLGLGRASALAATCALAGFIAGALAV
jgi:serine/threonine-protein kinase